MACLVSRFTLQAKANEVHGMRNKGRKFTAFAVALFLMAGLFTPVSVFGATETIGSGDA